MLDRHDRSWTQNAADHRGSYLPHYPNIRAGMVWTIEQGRNDLAYRYLGAIRGLWMPFGLTIQELPLVEQVLALPAPSDRTVLLRALKNSADCLQHSGQLQASEACLHEILALCRDLGDGERAAWAKLSLAGIKREAGLGEQALKVEEQVLQDFATQGENHLQGRMHRMLRARTRLGLALSLLELGRSEQALEFARRAEDGYRKAGNKVFELESRLTIGHLQLELHQRAEGQATLLACLNEAVEAGLRGVAEDIFR
ncbi:tetratricopeptide repeat protein [Deinococcus sp. QL22]|uniref:tetratricopeptide repeat protein n=1 Tax=Deinococcus sp. QL22 TaxID=2939437 RepID=UPI002017E65B|nr:tetratricopeptide repeat protein [Deinococcus sp. QL22]UQN09363.1 tetratricopeptide repeat protein [Deinococcus sp. QL22]